jgi:hypothetical protein
LASSFFLIILGLVLLCVLDHLLINVLLAQTSLVISDGDLDLLLASGLVFSIQNTVGIDTKADSDLRDTSRNRRDSRGELKLPKEIVVPSPGPLTLKPGISTSGWL